MLEELRNKIKEMMLSDIKEIIFKARNGNMILIEEKKDGDSATNADIQIGQYFVSKLKKTLPNSIVINEEDFNEEIFKDINKNKYIYGL